ncbi:helix-turn-helix domain-containing protein [Mycobacterium interjectum]|uniref:helix-turn-helix domain-containing protein n=1 Tax=Mycobacterium interjectum TaxID=33895 RepID=UPI000832135C|nr:helix-turn-helix transcriptional regulator [Mycobacterium interjectum]MCV7090214.1 helix-turn-helix transcriptional regulator [Mycobacterium interjectum]
MSSPRPLAVLVGENCKRMRERVGATQDELARCARDVGLRWDAGKVRRFESGDVVPSFSTVLAVTLALQMVAEGHLVAGEPIDWCYRGLSDLLESETDAYVNVTDKLMVRPETLRRVCEGFAWNTVAMSQDALATMNAAVDKLAGVIARQGLTEHRLAKRLGISPERLADLTLMLWGGTFSEERDYRLGPNVKQQNRSQMTRKMQSEIEEALANGDD